MVLSPEVLDEILKGYHGPDDFGLSAISGFTFTARKGY
jgi:hypothetical protein